MSEITATAALFLILGILAGLPMTLLVLASSREKPAEVHHTHTIRFEQPQEASARQLPAQVERGMIVVASEQARRIDQQRYQISGGEW